VAPTDAGWLRTTLRSGPPASSASLTASEEETADITRLRTAIGNLRGEVVGYSDGYIVTRAFVTDEETKVTAVAGMWIEKEDEGQ
jgi:hypothetical protein